MSNPKCYRKRIAGIDVVADELEQIKKDYEKLQQINKELIEALEKCMDAIEMSDYNKIHIYSEAGKILNKAKEG